MSSVQASSGHLTEIPLTLLQDNSIRGSHKVGAIHVNAIQLRSLRIMNKTKFNMRLLKTGISSNSEPILIFANNDSHGETFFPSCLSLITARESERESERARERERERVRERARYVGKEREIEWKRQLKR